MSYPCFTPEGVKSTINQCVERGFSTESDGALRTAGYAYIGSWLRDQYEAKTGNIVPRIAVEVMTDLSILMAHFDNDTDTGDMPNFEETYEPLLVSAVEGSSFKDVASSHSSLPPEFAPIMGEHVLALDLAKQADIASSWDILVLAMYDHKEAAVGGYGLRRFVYTRVKEAVALTDLYYSVLYNPDKDLYPQIVFKEWLDCQMATGNLVNSFLDYKADLADGHKPFAPLDRAGYAVAVLVQFKKYLTHPMTSREDREFMLFFLREYCIPKALGATTSSLTSRLSRSIGI